MFCPKCKTEYRPGFTRCADCGLPLVDTLPEERDETPGVPYENVELVQVLQTRDRSDMLSIKMVLDSEGVEYLMQGESLPVLRDPVVLLVKAEDAARVKELLKEIHLNFSNLIFNPKKKN